LAHPEIWRSNLLDGAARMPATVEAFKTGRKVLQYRDHRLEWMIKSGGIEVVLAGLRSGTIRFRGPNPQ
jgi:stringent starvation protein A